MPLPIDLHKWRDDDRSHVLFCRVHGPARIGVFHQKADRDPARVESSREKREAIDSRCRCSWSVRRVYAEILGHAYKNGYAGKTRMPLRVAAVMIGHVVNRCRCVSEGPVTSARLALSRVITPNCSSYGYPRMPCRICVNIYTQFIISAKINNLA
jgi:hypothetical protein